MFSNLMNFSYRRDLKGAIGFYLFYLILIVILSMVLAAIFGLIANQQGNFNLGMRIGNVIAIIACLFLSFMILKSKNKLDNGLFILLSLLSGVLAYFGGGLLGLIPIAYLSTK